jgi:RNA polymerase primary sigma factor
MCKQLNRLFKAKDQLTQENGRKPTVKELADKLGLSEEKVKEREGLAKNHTLLSLHCPLNVSNRDNGRGKSTLEETLEDTNPPPFDIAADTLLQKQFEEILLDLSPREATILRLRFGLGNRQPHTLTQVAKKLGVSHQAVSKTERRVLQKLRNHPIYANILEGYYSM